MLVKVLSHWVVALFPLESRTICCNTGMYAVAITEDTVGLVKILKAP